MAEIINTIGNGSCGYNAFAMCFAINVLENNVDKIIDVKDNAERCVPYYQELFRCIRDFHPNFDFKEGNKVTDVKDNLNQLKKWLRAYGNTAVDIQGLLAPPLRLFRNSIRAARRQNKKNTPNDSSVYENDRMVEIGSLKQKYGEWARIMAYRSLDSVQEDEDVIDWNKERHINGKINNYNELEYKDLNDVFECLQFEPIRYARNGVNKDEIKDDKVVKDGVQLMLRFCFNTNGSSDSDSDSDTDSSGAHYEWACPKPLFDKYENILNKTNRQNCEWKKHSNDENCYDNNKYIFPSVENAREAHRRGSGAFKSDTGGTGIGDFFVGIIALFGQIMQALFSGISDVFGVNSKQNSGMHSDFNTASGVNTSASSVDLETGLPPSSNSSEIPAAQEDPDTASSPSPK